MSITAREIAELLHITPAAVSMALNNKPGVSEQTRRKVIETAQKNGYDFSRINNHRRSDGSLALVVYKRQGAVLQDTPFFVPLTAAIENRCKKNGYKLQIFNVYKDADPDLRLEDILYSNVEGLIILGTEMQSEDYSIFEKAKIPMVLLDVYFDECRHDCILINNGQGAYLATNYLISQTGVQPGYLRSSYEIRNFEERADGFYRSIRHNGMSTSKSIVHRLSPSAEGAYSDMCAVIRSGDELAKAYFADNDNIAIGAMRAFAENGYKIPDDISIIGFDDIDPVSFVTPPLTTVHVPKEYMGMMAADRLCAILSGSDHQPVKTEIGTQLIIRGSVKKR